MTESSQEDIANLGDDNKDHGARHSMFVAMVMNDLAAARDVPKFKIGHRVVFRGNVYIVVRITGRRYTITAPDRIPPVLTVETAIKELSGAWNRADESELSWWGDDDPVELLDEFERELGPARMNDVLAALSRDETYGTD